MHVTEYTPTKPGEYSSDIPHKSHININVKMVDKALPENTKKKYLHTLSVGDFDNLDVIGICGEICSDISMMFKPFK